MARQNRDGIIVDYKLYRDKPIDSAELDFLSEDGETGRFQAACGVFNDWGSSARIQVDGFKGSQHKGGLYWPLTKHWTDWVDYWAVDFDYESRREIIQLAKTMGVEGEVPGGVDSASGEVIDIFGNDTMALVPVNVE